MSLPTDYESNGTLPVRATAVLSLLPVRISIGVAFARQCGSHGGEYRSS